MPNTSLDTPLIYTKLVNLFFANKLTLTYLYTYIHYYVNNIYIKYIAIHHILHVTYFKFNIGNHNQNKRDHILYSP